VRSSVAAVCSFQRIRIGTLSAAPAAAIMHATGTPVNVAALPQMALPGDIAPNMTATYIDRPRPRTHGGKAICAETLMVASAVIHLIPAIKLATRAVSAASIADHDPHGIRYALSRWEGTHAPP
jgi:hypothetical protein